MNNKLLGMHAVSVFATVTCVHNLRPFYCDVTVTVTLTLTVTVTLTVIVIFLYMLIAPVHRNAMGKART